MTNRLAQSNSLYLRKHAENPIDWWFWCDEALAQAQATNRPIFLSIGYSSCHWCTVMEGEAFSDPAIANYLNHNFLPIKVDREERPDIDSIYMQALQLMIGQGGWPLNIFLTPDDLVPFYGGTYFPLSPRFNRPGFLDVLVSIRRFYDRQQGKLAELKDEIFTHLQQSTILPQSTEELTRSLLENGIAVNTKIVGKVAHGPNFPMIPYASLVLASSRFKQNKQQAEPIAQHRGLDLALGGIYDHVGGGFHRYTVDATWTVPHFEKMLYDNGQISEYLANLWATGYQEPALKTALMGTVDWLRREMTAPEGYFYAAQDADSFITPDALEPEEGAFYVWTYQDLESLLTVEELTALSDAFQITPKGNFEGKIVLQRSPSRELTTIVQQALDRLFQVRYGSDRHSLESFPPARNNHEAKQTVWPGRIPAVTDTKMIVAWNSLMISGLARIHAVFNYPTALNMAIAATKFILDHQRLNDRLYRLNYDEKVAILAQSEDYALLIKSLLDLHQADLQNSQWIEQAITMQDEFDRLLWSADLGGYYNTAPDASPELLIQERSYQDNATPAANGTAIINLIRLGLLTENLGYFERAETALKSFSSVLEKIPQSVPSLCSALDWWLHGRIVKVLDTSVYPLISEYFPTVIFLDQRDRRTELEPNNTENRLALVCQDLSCLEPAPTIAQLRSQLEA